MTADNTNQSLGLFAHYRPVVLALPARGCEAVAAFLGAESVNALVIQLEAAGLLYRHQHWGSAVSQLLHAALDEPMLNGLPEQLFRWNPEAKVVVEPLRLALKQGPEEESLELDVRFRSDHALLAGPLATPALVSRLRNQGNLWWSTGKGDPIDGREQGSMDSGDEYAWAEIIAVLGLTDVSPAELVVALDEFADCAIDFRYSDSFLEAMALKLGMHTEYLEAWQQEGCGVITDVGDLKIQGYC
jgi:hypothetical protein